MMKMVQEDNSEVSEADDQEMPNMASGRHIVKKMGKRNMISFWIFGLCNNFAYVVMLSAAHDILKEEEKPSNSSGNSSSTVGFGEIRNNTSNVTYLECNSISTGAILLADILPTLFVKLTFPFFIQKIPYKFKVSLVSVFILASFLIVAFAHEIWLSIIGIVCASIAGGVGEITFLSLTTFYHINVVSMWSSGTGGAGVLGALAYAGFTTAGLSPRNTLLVMIVVPVLMMVTYIFVLQKPEFEVNKKKDDVDDHTMLLEDDKPVKIQLTLRQKLLLIPNLFQYMIPLLLVYFGEYFINQGLHELLYFNGVWLSKSEQYRWYQVDYQIGVFISRSSVNVIHIRKLWILPILQFVNLTVLLCHVFFRFIPTIWIVLLIVFWEGLLGGAAYVNTFYKMTNELPADKKEYCIGVATLGDSVGIAAAGAVAIPAHQAICDMCLKM